MTFLSNRSSNLQMQEVTGSCLCLPLAIGVIVEFCDAVGSIPSCRVVLKRRVRVAVSLCDKSLTTMGKIPSGTGALFISILSIAPATFGSAMCGSCIGGARVIGWVTEVGRGARKEEVNVSRRFSEISLS